MSYGPFKWTEGPTGYDIRLAMERLEVLIDSGHKSNNLDSHDYVVLQWLQEYIAKLEQPEEQL